MKGAKWEVKKEVKKEVKVEVNRDKCGNALTHPSVTS